VSDALLEVQDLSVRSRAGVIVDRLDLRVARGETIGLVGESGSGKSLTARALLGLLPAGVTAGGTAVLGGRSLLSASESDWRRLRGRKIVLMLQDPFTMLNPLMRVGKQITETVRVADGRRLSRQQRPAEAIRRLREVGIRDAKIADRYPFQLSGGMRQRVGLASALASDPDLLIADEPSTALDVTTQREILRLIRSVQSARGMGVILITHDLRVGFSMCDRVYVLYAGAVLEVAPARQMEERPLHPYTQGLFLSEPRVDARVGRLTAVPGNVPAAAAVVAECAFATRCRWAVAACRAQRPPLVEVEPGRLSSCIRISEISDVLRVPVDRPGLTVDARRATTDSIRVTGLTKRFGSGEGSTWALAGVSVGIGVGESVGLVGESGSGKTTLARCVIGLERPTAGTIEIEGVDASDPRSLPARTRTRLRQTVQMVFQDPYSTLNPARSIGFTLREALRCLPEPPASFDRVIAELLERVGLPSAYAARKPSSLSGGERQRVAIARSLALEPRILICDEPVSALDVSVQAQILNLFSDLRDSLGLGYLFITHDLAVVRQVADRLYVLRGGLVVEEGATEDVLDHPSHPYTRELIASVPSADPGWLSDPSFVPTT
jgi:peptide/nickel transport system ATP-binding protein